MNTVYKYRVVVGENGNEEGHIMTAGTTEAEAREALARELAKYRGDGWGRIEFSRVSESNWQRL